MDINESTQMSFTIGANSKILAQFSAPFLLSLDPSFIGLQEYLVTLVIKGVGNTTTPIVYYDGSSASGQTRQLTHNPTLTFMTDNLPVGTYNCSIQWKSTQDAPGTNNLLSVSHHNLYNTYHYDRWMLLEEITS